MELGALLRLVKNLRGVIYAVEPAGAVPLVAWVRRKFQYRTVGYTPLTKERFDRAGLGRLLEQKPFRPLFAPSKPLGSLVELCCSVAGDDSLAEAVLLSSFHVAPLLLLGRGSAERAASLSLFTLDASPQTDAEAKRHLRILDYAILDAHGDSSRRGADALVRAQGHVAAGKASSARRAVSAALKREAQFAENDCKKRFWRLIESRTASVSPTVLYLHPLCLVRDVLKDKQAAERLADLISRSAEALEPCLSVVPAFVVQPG